MASKKTHIVIGVVAALAIYGIYKSSKNKDWDFWEMCGAAVLGGFAGAVPDLLEPANSSHHRQFFHSFTLLACFLFKEKAYDSLQLKEPHRSICNIFIASYSSHLLADSITPRSLPLI